MKCVICGEDEADGKYEEFGICPICGDILDDIIAFCFKKLQESESGNLSEFFEKEVDWLEELASWMTGWVMEKNVETARGADERYFKRLELVAGWMRSNPDVLKNICDKYCKCEGCGTELTSTTVVVKEEYEWLKVLCKNCSTVIAKCFSPKEF